MRELPIPVDTSVQALVCGWDGRVYAGLSTISAPDTNLVIFDGPGAGTPWTSGPAQSGRMLRQMQLSGDGLRVFSSHVIPDANFTRMLSFYDLP